MQLASAPQPSFVDAVRQIAAEMLDGENVESRIGWLACRFKQDRASVRHQIDEMVDLIRD